MTSKQAAHLDSLLERLRKVEELLEPLAASRVQKQIAQNADIFDSQLLSYNEISHRAKILGSKILAILDKELEELEAEKEEFGSTPSLRKRFRKLYQRRARARSIFNL